MQKSMYSLMLMDDIVKEIDILAQEKNTNRSNLINQILAKYISFVTPEEQISDIFNYLDGLLSNAVFSSVTEQCESIMSVKTSLDYKYRPTLKYSVELIKYPKDILGYLKVAFRTQSATLLTSLEYFFNEFAKLESEFLYKNYGIEVSYTLEGGKFTRTLAVYNDYEPTIVNIAQGISDYIAMLDELIKDFLAERYTSFSQIKQRYLQYINHKNTLII